jgi:hypothetical protein
MKVSNTFREILKIGPEFHIRADMVLKSGEQLSLKECDLMGGTFEFIDSTSASGKLEIGTVTAQQFKVNLNNFYNQFSASELEGAVITPYISLVTRMDWRGPQMEQLKRGRFTVSGPKSVGSAIQLSAWDTMLNFAQAYTKSTLKYPATLGQIVADACACCGVALATPTFTNSGYSVASRPSDSALTFRDVISHAAKLAGCFARCNADGALELRWYDFSRFSLSDADENRPWELSGIMESDIKEADTAVTGVQITGTDSAKTIYTSGKDGFVISISNNPLAQDGLQAVADTLGSKLIGMTFRPFTATANENPAIEAGDVCYIADADGNRHRSIISNLDYKIYQDESYSGNAESAGENSTVYYSPAQKAQNAADTAQAGVDEAKTEITQLNGQIVLKADKGSLVAEINISPEGIKISADKLELSGLVTITGVEDGTTIINGGCMKTGRIESVDGSWWLDLETGKFYLKNGTFAGDVIWTDEDGNKIGSITCGGQAGLVISGSKISVESPDLSLNAQDNSPTYIKNLDVGDTLKTGELFTDGEKGMSTEVGIRMSNDTNRTLKFVNGLLVNNDA